MEKEIPKITAIFLITVGIVVLGLNFIFFGPAPKSKATGETISFVFNPASVNQASGDFIASVRVRSSVDMTIRGYQFEIAFDRSRVQFKNIQYKIGVVSPGVGDDDSKITAINQNGRIKVVSEIQSAAGQVISAGQNTEVATVSFTALSSQPSSITTGAADAKFFMINTDYSLFDAPSAGQASLSVNGGSITPTRTPTPTVTPTATRTSTPTVTPTPTNTAGNANLKIKLKFQGIIGKPGDSLNKLNVKIKLYDMLSWQETDYKTVEFTADDKGIWSGNTSFNVEANARYIIFVKGPYHIQKKICDFVPVETAGGTYRCTKGNITLRNGDNDLNFSGVLLLAGDLPPQDGSITAYDTSLIYNNLGKNNDRCDVNRDGKCDTQDYSLVIAALSIKNDEL